MVDAILLVLDSPEANGDVYNIGSTTEVGIENLAWRVIARTGSASGVRMVPFEDAYEPGFEELGRRVPDTAKLRALTGWNPRRTIDDAIDDVIHHEQLERAQVA